MGCGHPEWLPEGWKVQVKVRSCGRKDKYYVNLANDLKFNSKPDVLRYLESSDNHNKPNDPNKDKIEINTNAVDDLPPGWIKEIRIIEKRGRVRRDEYFTDTVSGCHFRSLEEVFRYLESKDSGKPKNKLDDEELDNDPNSLCVNGKGQKSINQKTDESLIEHETEKSAVNLACNNVNSIASNHLEQAEDNYSPDINLSDQPQSAKRTKQQSKITRKTVVSAQNKVDRIAVAGQLLVSGLKVPSLGKADEPVKVVEQNDEESGSRSGKLFKKLARGNKVDGHEVGKRQSKRLAGIKVEDSITNDRSLQSVTEASEEKNVHKEKSVHVPETNGPGQREEENHPTGVQHDVNTSVQTKKTNPKRKWVSDLPRRTSKRLAGVKVNITLEEKPGEKAGADASGLPGEAELKTAKDICKAEQANEVKVNSKGKAAGFSNTSEHHRTENIIDYNQKRPGGDQVNHLSSLNGQKSVSADGEENENSQNFDSVLNDLLMDPCIEFAIKTLTGAIPIEEITRVNSSTTSSLASPAQALTSSSTQSPVNIRADPCFEFAVKTLTSDSPTENNSSSSRDNNQMTTTTLPKFRIHNHYPSNHSFGQSDALGKPLR